MSTRGTALELGARRCYGHYGKVPSRVCEECAFEHACMEESGVPPPLSEEMTAVVVRTDFWAQIYEIESEIAAQRMVRQTLEGDFDLAAQSMADAVDHDIVSKLLRKYSSGAFPLGLLKPWRR